MSVINKFSFNITLMMIMILKYIKFRLYLNNLSILKQLNIISFIKYLSKIY